MTFNQRLVGISFQSDALKFASREDQQAFYAAIGYAAMWGSDGSTNDTTEVASICIDKRLEINVAHYPKAAYDPAARYTGSPTEVYDTALKSVVGVVLAGRERPSFVMAGIPSKAGDHLKYSFHS